jgi:DnaA family protein
VQLSLDIALRDQATLDRFIPGNNQELVNLLGSLADSATQQMIVISGLKGSGKTHLLQAACRQVRHAIYLPLGSIAEPSPDIFEQLSDHPLVCLDDLQAIAGNNEMQLALFSLMNGLREQQRSFIASLDCRIDQAGFSLKDLVSRLQACGHYAVEAPQDQHKIDFLKMDAQRRGLQLSNEVISWILTHTPRDMANLVSLMNRLDRESLRSQRRPTIPFIKQMLKRNVI